MSIQVRTCIKKNKFYFGLKNKNSFLKSGDQNPHKKTGRNRKAK